MSGNGLKINTGLVKLQHKSNMVSQMLGSGNSALPTLMGAGTARMQAMAITQQMDTFERLSSLGTADAGTYGAGSVKGTAREQAKAIMKEYEESAAAEETAAESAETPGDAEKTEAAAEAEE